MKESKQSEKPTQPEQATPPKEDFHTRFLEREWTKLGEDFDAKGLIKGLRKYIDSEGPIYPLRDKRFRALHDYLYFAVPDPTLLKPLLGARKDASEIEDWVLRRDHIAMAIVTSYYRRLVRRKDDPYTRALWDTVAYAGVHFSFDPLFGDSHTQTGAEISDLFMDPQLPACKESREALEAHMETMLSAWRKRVTEKASTSMMGIVIRHVGAAGVDRLFGEWDRMSKSEKFNLLSQAGDHRGLATASKKLIVESLLADLIETREAALEALNGLGAPVADVEIGAPDEELREAVKPLRRWASKTDS